MDASDFEAWSSNRPRRPLRDQRSGRGADSLVCVSSSSNAGATGGGGAEPLPRVITLEYRGNGGSPIDDGRVLVSYADGTLRDVLLPSELPADVLVTDGQLVSFFRLLDSEIPLRIESFRVSPGVTTKIVGGSAPLALCDVDPPAAAIERRRARWRPRLSPTA